MGRYAFTYVVNEECVLYAESTAEEDKLDMDFEDESSSNASTARIATDWTGNGWLAFWKRCMGMTLGWRAKHGMVSGTCHAYDNWFDTERSW